MPGHEHGADHHVGALICACEVEAGRITGADAPAELGVEFAQLLVDIEHGDVRAHPASHAGDDVVAHSIRC